MGALGEQHADRDWLWRAPFVAPAIAMILGVLLSDACGTFGAAAVLVALRLTIGLAVAGFVWWTLRLRGVVAITTLTSILIAGGIGFVRHQQAIEQPAAHLIHACREQPVLTRIIGEVVTAPVYRPTEKRNPFLPFDPPAKTRFILNASEVIASDQTTPTMGLLRVSIAGPLEGLRVGDRAEITGELFRIRGPRNPGDPDWRRLNANQGILAGLSVESSAHVRNLTAPGARGWLAIARAALHAVMFEGAAVEPSDGVGVLDALLIGQRSSVNQAIDDAFMRTGTIHVLSVSGFHVGVLAAAVWWLVSRLAPYRRRLAAAATMFVVIGYALLAEPSAPVFRALIMALLAGTAAMMGRPLSVTNWLSLSAIIVLTVSPQEVFRAGFQLSFGQVAVLLLLVPPLYRAYIIRGVADVVPRDAHSYSEWTLRATRRLLGGGVLVSVVLWATSAPLIWLHFGMFTPWAWLQSLLLSPAFSLLVVLGFAVLIANAIGLLVGVSLTMPLLALTDFLLVTVKILGRAPASIIELPPPTRLEFVLSYLAIAGIVLLAWRFRSGDDDQSEEEVFRRQRLARWMGLGLAIVGIAGVGAAVTTPARSSPDAVDVHVMDVGSGSANLLRTREGRGIAIDCGTDANFDAGDLFARVCRAEGITDIRAVSVSHANFDHYSGTPTIAERFSICEWWLGGSWQPSAAWRRSTSAGRPVALPAVEARSLILNLGQTRLIDDCALEVLWPPHELSEGVAENDRSLVLKMRYADRTILFPGDIERFAIGGLIEAAKRSQVDLRADVLVAPHHGGFIARSTEAFLAAVRPRWIVVSSRHRRERFERAARRILGEDVPILTTGDVGCVRLRITSDGEIRVLTPFAD